MSFRPGSISPVCTTSPSPPFSLHSRLQAVSFSGPSPNQALLPPHHYILFPPPRVLFPSPLLTFLTAIHPIRSDVSSLGNLLDRLGGAPPRSSHSPWWLRSLYILISKRSLLNFSSKNKPCFSRQTRTHPLSKNWKPFQRTHFPYCLSWQEPLSEA